ncbi:MAG: amidohydrolase [Ectothiorhodospiraceae bacterium]|nr:amidohydrolase [Ectothiorhodospiraceae bacterium]
MTAAKQTALDWIEANRAAISADHQTLWEFAEPAWREYRSAAWYVDRLRAEGFEVEAGSAGMPTAFCARWGDEGPVLGGYAEYDAVPGRTQAQTPYRKPREGYSAYAAGHTDPHSALGIGAFAGFIAAKRAFERHGIKARLKFFGEPAEKMCGSKPVHAAHGYYDDLDAAISFHPASFEGFRNSCYWDTACLAYWSKIYTFRCDSPQTWTAEVAATGHGHSSNRAPGSLDAVCMMYTLAKQLKESMLPRSGGWTLNEHVLVAGQATSDNLAPNIGQIQYSCRAPTLAMHEPVFAVLDRTARQVAEMTHCTLEETWVTKTRVGLPNRALAALTFGNFALVGPPAWDQAARDFGREIQRGLGLTPMDDPFPASMSRLTQPEDGEAWMRSMLPPWQMHYGADDYVDYTWHAPTVRLYVARPVLAEPSPGYRYPEWTRYAMGGLAATIDPMWHAAGRTIATTLVDLATDPAALAAAQQEFRERTGGGIGGERWVAPLLPGDFKAPVDFAWPEYVDTPRGREWTLRSP